MAELDRGPEAEGTDRRPVVPGEGSRLEEMQDRTRRDVDRLRRRGADGRFWRSLGLIGSVGWPIVLLAAGGALLGRYLDDRLGTGIRFALGLLALGTVLGSIVAFRALRGNGS